MVQWFLGVLLIALTSGVSAESLQLIKEEEAKLAPMPTKLATRAITRGPGIKMASPENVSGAFPFKVVFEPRGDAKIDRNTIKVEYLKGAGIDLTERLKSGIKSDSIEIPAALAPVGEHPIRVSVTDNEGRQGAAEFKLVVK